MTTASYLKGFTLIELLIALTILTVITALSFPSLRDYLQQTDDEILASTVINTLEFAHQIAMARHENVGVRFDDQVMTVFIEPQTKLVTRHLPLKSGKIFWRSYPAYRDYLQFQYHGNMLSDNATIWYCRKNAAQPSWAVVVNKVGDVRMQNANQSMRCDFSA